MANAALDDDDVPTKRESHFNNQRSSLRSSTLSEESAHRPRPPSRTRSDQRWLYDFNLDLERNPSEHANSEPLPSPSSTASPAPNVPYTRHRNHSYSSVKRWDNKNAGRQHSLSTVSSRVGEGKHGEDLVAPESWLHLYNENAHSPSLAPPLPPPRTRGPSRQPQTENARGSPLSQTHPHRSRRPSFPLGRVAPGAASGSQLDITALPSMSPVQEDGHDHTHNFDHLHADAENYLRSKRTPGAQKASRLATELYTISYLIFFSIWGTLARLGLQALTFYPGAPVIFSELWANVAGTFIMGFLSEDRRLFAAEWGVSDTHDGGEKLPEPTDYPANDAEHSQHKARHGKIKKTIPMYIGLATGFCGSFTSFSSFIRDIFLALSNDLKSPINHPYPASTAIPSVTTTVPRNGGYSVMAILATIIITIATCYCALHIGAHLALALDRFTPSLPFRLTRRVFDPVFVILGWGVWFGAIVMVCLPPYNAWRSQALFACVFAPAGCLLRYYISLLLNPIAPSFPLGTFTVNIFGTAVLGMAYDLQHVPLSSTGLVGGSGVGCAVLQGIQDGFCGCLTTVSTWIVEIDTAKRRRNAYVYGGVSVGAGLGLLVVVMGSVRWTVGWEEMLCVT
jgi:CrcB protein